MPLPNNGTEDTDWGQKVDRRINVIETMVQRRHEDNVKRMDIQLNRLDHIESKVAAIEQLAKKAEPIFDEWIGAGPRDKDSMHAQMQKLLGYQKLGRLVAIALIAALGFIATVVVPIVTLWGIMHHWWEAR